MYRINDFCRRFGILLMVIASLSASAVAQAESTEVRVLVRSVDAKFIGSGVGGLNVTIKNADTGALLAHGQVTGGTGDTQTLMKTGEPRGSSSTKGDPASFGATLDLQQPTRVEVAITGPLAVPQGIQAVSVTSWVIPGQDIVEPGLILHMPGLITNLTGYERNGRELNITADVTMMCGCPITQDGLWAADDFEVVAEVYDQDQSLADANLIFTGQTNEFSGTLTAPKSGELTLVVHAFQKSTGNAGVYKQRVTIE